MFSFLKFARRLGSTQARMWLAACAVLAASGAQGHEFWLVPVRNPLQVGETAHVQVRVGEFFQGDSLGFSAPQSVALRLHTPEGSRDLLPALAARGPVPELSVQMRSPGTTLLSFDSQPNQIVLSADTFHAYLHDEGIDFIKVQRVAAGTANLPGRERYRRFVKTLIRVQSPDGAAAAVPAPVGAVPGSADALGAPFRQVVGQRLEIIPANDPTLMAPGEDLTVKLLFEGKPLAGALVKAWHRQQGQLLTLRASTDADGNATVTLPHPGEWMVSVVHMVPAVGVKDIDWDSLWANLSFVVAAPAKAS